MKIEMDIDLALIVFGVPCNVFNKETGLDWDCHNAIIHVDYSPPRKAPCTSNHDNPGFSDPGDPEEIDVYKVVWTELNEEAPIELLYEIEEKLWEVIAEHCRENY